MQNSFFQAICRIGIFMICVRAVIHFRPNEAYEKYLRLIAGILIMIQLFLPVGRVLLGKGGQEAADMLQQFRQELERGMEEAAESAAAADALLEQMTLEEIQRRLEEQAVQENTAGGEGKPGEGTVESREGNPGEGTVEGREGKPGEGTVESREGNPGEEEAGTGGIAVQVKEIKPVSIGPLPSEAE